LRAANGTVSYGDLTFKLLMSRDLIADGWLATGRCCCLASVRGGVLDRDKYQDTGGIEHLLLQKLCVSRAGEERAQNKQEGRQVVGEKGACDGKAVASTNSDK